MFIAYSALQTSLMNKSGFSFFGFAETGKTDRVGDRHREGNAVGFAFKSRFGINRTKNLVF